MPNPFHYRSTIDRLTRLTGPSHPGYIRLRAVNALLRELSPANPQSAANNQMLQAVDSWDLARHKLRDLYDRDDLTKTSPLGGGAPHLCGAEGAALTEEESPEEDDDPL